MSKTRRLLGLVLCILMCFVSACGANQQPAASQNPATSNQPPAPPASSPSAPSPSASVPSASASPSAMAPAPTEPEVKYADHIDVIQTNNSVAVINPFSPAASTQPTNWVFTMIYDRLIERDDDTGEFVPSLAKEWKTDDYQTYVFTLRDDVYFHNGDKLTVDDVLFTINKAQDSPGTSGANQWSSVDTARVIDSSSIEVVLKYVYPNFRFNLAFPAAGILNKKAVEADPEKGTWVGTGPYTVVEFVERDYVRYARNDNYWNKGKNIITSTIVQRFVPELSARTIRMQNGESHLSFGTSESDMYLFEDNPDFEVLPHVYNQPTGLSFNMNDPITGDYNFRMAVIHAIDKEEATFLAIDKWGIPWVENGSVWGYDTPYYNRDIPGIPHDVNKAKEYLALSNYNGEEVEIAAGLATDIRAVQVIQQQLLAVGINTVFKEFDGPGLNAYMIDRNSGSQMIERSFPLDLNPSSIRNYFHSESLNNRMQYSNPEVDRLLDEAARQTDPAAAEASYKKIQELISLDVPYTTIHYPLKGNVAARGLGGLKYTAEVDKVDLREIYLIIN